MSPITAEAIVSDIKLLNCVCIYIYKDILQREKHNTAFIKAKENNNELKLLYKLTKLLLG